MTATFTYTLDEMIDDIGDVTTFFKDTFITFADMFFNSPFVLYIGIGIIIGILAIVASFLRIRQGAA